MVNLSHASPGAASRSPLAGNPSAPNEPLCRGCGAVLSATFVDLGFAPLSNDYLSAAQLREPLTTYPLHVRICHRCLLVQLEAFEDPGRHFGTYRYFSSFSTSWLAHARRYVQSACERFALDARSQVVELASNDGYLLQYFAAAGIPVLGVEPAANVAAVALARGIPTDVAFFGEATARRLRAQGYAADLIVANNVLAHVPDVHDFVAGIALLLKDGATATLEFPHLLNLLAETQFDTIYHEHFSYFSLLALEAVFVRHGLAVVDVECIPTHGGSLRVYAGTRPPTTDGGARVDALRALERRSGLDAPATYRGFEPRVRALRDRFVRFLADARAAGHTVAAYGAAAKGNTFLNYCGVRADQIAFVADRSPHKQQHFLPGSLIPIVSPEAIRAERPDYVVILPWNIREEIVEELAFIRTWGGRFVVAVPQLTIF